MAASEATQGSLQATARETRAAVLKSAKTQQCQHHRTKVLTKGKHWELGQRPSLFITIRRLRGGSRSTTAGWKWVFAKSKKTYLEGKELLGVVFENHVSGWGDDPAGKNTWCTSLRT